MIFTSPHELRPGAAVLLKPRKGFELPTYARVLTQLSPDTASVVVTATSGGRQRGLRYTAPLGCLTVRAKGLHRKPSRLHRLVKPGR